MPEYQGWYEAISEPPTYTMVTNRQQSRFRFLKNGVAYTFKVFAVNPVARRESEWSSPVHPSTGANKTEYLREKKRVACLMREKVLQERKLRKQKKAQEQQAIHQKKREDLQNLEEKETRNELRKKFDRKKKREGKLAERERKKQQERTERQKKMDEITFFVWIKLEQRKKVLSNKRRISMIHRERINDMQVQWTARGRNPNTVSSMVAQSMAAADKSKIKALKAKTDKDSLTLTSPEKNKSGKSNSSEQSPKKSQTKKQRPDTKEDEKMD
ncbi:hypothetical protein RFI_22841 [Reticulomyxa filosa]|uniref:Fibronectin type-III domain-containing protein n=1 Tax=Reticulomyxa filosa TaxID=46433 RepID=X6MLK3_RETFI|nr:hypothetical protein RFI_22841 [Reticulomyxa filosa]|eukprot:ETO14526.1 hypothetical protein RFI_22841 [Reticulomyxa filosa]